MPRYTLYLLQNSEGSFGGFLQSDALMVSLLERLLGSLAATANSLGVKLEIRSTGVHVEQLRAMVVMPERGRALKLLALLIKVDLPSEEHGDTERS